jgi:16S rRNA (guanine(966)-N(2))-methyltransferase RsmD
MKRRESLPKTTRPTTGRAREALFNLLQTRVNLRGAACLELFAGTGAVALECLKRGATRVDAVEIRRSLVVKLQEQFARHPGGDARAFAADARDFLRTAAPGYDFIFLDPPYATTDKELWVEKCLRLLNADGRLVLEHPFYENYQALRGYVETRRYGLGAFSFFAPCPDE